MPETLVVSTNYGGWRFATKPALKIVKLVILITDTVSLNVVISLAGGFMALP